MARTNFRTNLFIILITISFIFLYLIFLIFVYIVPNELNISYFIIIGIITIIIGVILFINFNQDLENSDLFKIKFLSENSIKIILVVLNCLGIFISPIFTPMSVILWSKIGIWNIIRAIILIVGAMFLPGSCLFNIFFHNLKLHEKFKIEPFIIKITFYPILSLAFIGLSVLIIDQIGLTNKTLFSFILFFLIIGLYIIDIITQKIRFNNLNIRTIELEVSKNTFVILIVATGFIFFSIGTFFGTYYLVPGDSWAGMGGAIHIGMPNTSPIIWGQKYLNYPIFWSYIIFGLSILAGLPLINTNALLGPFCYLYLTSIYLLIKAILYGFKEKYAVLATILLSLFSGLFYIKPDLTPGKATGIIIVENFFGKSYAYILFFVALSLFIIISKTLNNRDFKEIDLIKIKEYKLLILASFFLVLSFIIYAFPLIISLIFIFSYCLFSTKKRKNFQLFSHLLLGIMIFFIIFDVLMIFYLSSLAIISIKLFFPFPFTLLILNIVPLYLFVYSILGCLFVLSYGFKIIYLRILSEIKRPFPSFILGNKKILRIILISFTFFLIFEISAIIIEIFFLNFYLDQKFIFFYYLDEIFLSIGLIGILAIYLSYLSFRKDKNLFYILVIWVIVSFFIASILIFLNVFNSRSFLMSDIDDNNILLMNFWFNRIWFYSIIPFSILTSIGLFKIGKKIKKHTKFKNLLANENHLKIFKVISIFIIIFLSSTNFFLLTIFRAHGGMRPNEEEIKLYGWMSENIPNESGILIEHNYNIRMAILSLTYADYYFIRDFFDSDDTQTEMIDEIKNLKDDDIQYICISREFLRDDGNVSVFVRSYLIPYFYNESEYKSENYRIYYAPYFD